MSVSIVRHLIVEHFNLEELALLCADLEVPFENLGGNGLEAKSQALLAHMARRGRLAELVSHCVTLRPHVTWPEADEAWTELDADATARPPAERAVPLLYTLAIIGLPVTVFALSDEFVQLLTGNPTRGVGLLGAYVLVMVAFGFAARIWQRLEGELVDSSAGWLRAGLRDLTSGTTKRYLQHLIYRHRDFDVKGLSTQGTFNLMLEHVFVELSMAPQVIHQVSSDPVRGGETLLDGQHTIWGFLAVKPLADQSLAILGAPGSGKTTLLKHMTLVLTDAKKRAQHHAPDRVPILLFLRSHAQAIAKKPDYTLVEAITQSLKNERMLNPPPSAWFEALLRQGRCLVMLDGLDEVADTTTRQRVATWVEQQILSYRNNRFVITSRPFGYRSNPLSGVAVLEVRPFTHAQVAHFVERWYLANEVMSSQANDRGVHMKAQEGADDLLHRVRNSPALTALAVNPLLLTMIATVHRYRSSLPGRRVELYAEICEVFLGKRQQARGIELDLTPAQKQRVLQPLAAHMMHHQQREIRLEDALTVIRQPLRSVSPASDEREFLKAVENSSGLLLERENGEYSFAHLTFQEYLAAIHLLEEQAGHVVLAHLEDSWWHETIRLYCARTDATPVISACLSHGKSSVIAFTLAIECVEEAREVQPAMRKTLDGLLRQGTEAADPDLRRLVAETLLALRLKRMSRVADDLYVDERPVSHAEYQLFLDDQRARGRSFAPDHWMKDSFPTGQGRRPVVGVRPADAVAFCQWLTERESEGWRYRLPQPGEYDLPPGEVGYWVRESGSPTYILENGPPSQFTLAALEARLLSDLGRARALEPDLSRAHARVQELARAFDLDPARAPDLDTLFDLDLTRALERADTLPLDLERPLDLATDLHRALDLDVDVLRRTQQTLNRDGALELDRSLTRALKRAMDMERARARALALALARALSLALARKRGGEDLKSGYDSLRWMLRVITWLVADVLLVTLEARQANRSFLDRLANKERKADEEIQRLADSYLDLYHDFALLEERLEGKLPAIEGIRIVRQWRT